MRAILMFAIAVLVVVACVGSVMAGNTASMVITLSVEPINMIALEEGKILWTTNEDSRIVQVQAPSLPEGMKVHFSTSGTWGEHFLPPELMGKVVLEDNMPKTLVKLQRGAGGCMLKVWAESFTPAVAPVTISIATESGSPFMVETMLVMSEGDVTEKQIQTAVDGVGVITITDTE